MSIFTRVIGDNCIINLNPILCIINLKLKNRPKFTPRRQGFFVAGCNGTRSAPSALHFVCRWLQSALSRRLNLCLGPKKLINSTLFVAGNSNTIEIKYLRNNSSDMIIPYFTAYLNTLFL